VACVHPEDVLLKAGVPQTEPNGSRNVLAGTVLRLKPHGRSALALFEWEGGRLEALLTRATYEELDLAPGQRLYAVFGASAVQVVRHDEPPTG
jgi:molybdopterin-binding protein